LRAGIASSAPSGPISAAVAIRSAPARPLPAPTGKRDNPSNVRNRYLDSAAKIANADLRAAGREPMPDVTPHSLRCTFISLLLAAGADVPSVMAQSGHTDPKMTLGLYAQVIASKTDHGAALDGIVEGAFAAFCPLTPESTAARRGPTPVDS
jgi:integrase